jgi:hypothetical protein
VASVTGELIGVASIDQGIARGAVSVPHGFDGPGQPNVGELISDTTDLDPLTGMVLQSGLPISVEPLVHAQPSSDRVWKSAAASATQATP